MCVFAWWCVLCCVLCGVRRITCRYCCLVSVLFFFSWSGDHRDLHSFPTRRSSDLRRAGSSGRSASSSPASRRPSTPRAPPGVERSEEHTSELQSRENLVCRLLLEKKKKNIKTMQRE